MAVTKEEVYEKFKIAYGHVRNAEHEEAIPLLREIFREAEEVGEHYLCARCMNSLGVVYATIGNEVMALDCYLQGLDYALKHKVVGTAHYFYNNIGSRYQELEDYNKALDYFMLAEGDMETYLTLGPENAINFVVTYLNLGDCYRYFKAFDRAERYLQRATKVMNDYHVVEYSFPIELFKVSLYMDQGRTEDVKKHLDSLVEAAVNGKDNLADYSRFVKLLADILTRLRDMEHLHQLIESFSEIAIESDSVQMRLQLQEHCMDYYEAVGDWENYQKACVQHAILYRERRAQGNQELVLAMNVKIQLRRTEMEMREEKKKSETDALTGLRNRFGLTQDAKQILADCKKKGMDMAMGIIDVDCFKQYNDTYGHKEGDMVLRRVAGVIKQVVDPYGCVYRYGGDEFVLVMSEMTEDKLRTEVAEKIAGQLEELHIENKNSDVEGFITVTQGYAVGKPQRTAVPDDYFTKADACLYRGKEKGKNDYEITRID